MVQNCSDTLPKCSVCFAGVENIVYAGNQIEEGLNAIARSNVRRELFFASTEQCFSSVLLMTLCTRWIHCAFSDN